MLPKLMPRNTSKQGLWITAILIMIGSTYFIFFKAWQKADPYEEMLRENAKFSRINPAQLVELNRLEMLIAADKASPSKWAELEKLLKSPNKQLRNTAYSVLIRARQTSGKERAVQLTEQMKSDPDPGIRARYAWQMMLVDAPNWRDICERDKNSPDPETSRLATQALKQGDKLGR